MNVKMTIHKKIKSILCVILIILSVFQFPLYVNAVESTESKVIVSMGDSYSSGEGIEEFYGQGDFLSEKVTNLDWLAHRSKNSWSGQLKLSSVGVMNEHRNENWYFVAASGATTADINGQQRKTYYKKGLKVTSGIKYLPAQIDIFDTLKSKNQEADYVTLTLGGNDADFTGIIISVVVGSTYLHTSLLSDKINETLVNYYKSGGIKDHLYDTYKNISEKSGNKAHIIVAGYPKLFEENGKGFAVSKKEASYVNAAVTNFNNCIEKLVNQCKDEGMKISFVSVEKGFEGHAAYSDTPYIHEVIIGTKEEDLMDFDIYLIKEGNKSIEVSNSIASAYSMHPNKDGSEIYRKCVQDKINELEKLKQNNQQEATASPPITPSSERDVVLVLDTSGSMGGEPLEQTKRAAEKFVDTVLAESANVAIVNYEDSADMASDFTNNASELKRIINELYDGGGTNIESGLKMAEQMLAQSNAEKKIIVLMSDGQPNDGLVGEELISYSDTLKENGTYIYTLGFFESMGDEKSDAQLLMEGIASEGCHYEVSDAESLVFFFGDIADQINGQKYIYVRIACPVDVSVEYNGETLDSSERNLKTRTDFGSLTFEDSNEETTEDSDYAYSYDSGVNTQDDRVKILRLKEGENYDIKIVGTGRGRMDYSIGFMDENGEYSDFRKFKNVAITRKTEIDTVAAVTDKTVLNVDEDGDGRYDITYEARQNENGRIVDYSYMIYILVGLVGFLILLIVILVVSLKIKKYKQRKFYK